ncbi:MAG: aminotransferase class V-fold PLP-dependent enzyme [Deltaproteobacteria bacterium]|nr:aminotransferase class V-fold PLP-dependent enzyme [Deltaproteobacteria bacterium]
MPVDFDKLRASFPVVNQLAYFNHAAVAPLPVQAAEAINAYLKDVSTFGAIHENRWLKEIEVVRERYARLINADPGEIAFLKSTSAGVQLVAQGVDFKAGGKVVTADVEFPANVYPWMALAPRGIEVKFVGAREGRVEPQDVERAIDAKTRVVALSLVEFGNGFRNHVEEVGEVCRRKGVHFFLDAIQGVGAIPFDVKAFNIDFVAVGAHKWLLGPQGVGIFFCRKEIIDRLRFEDVSWRSVVDEDDFTNYRMNLKPDARRFEGDQPNFMGILGLGGSLALREEIGNPVIFARVRALADRLIDGLAERGYAIRSPMHKDERSGIVSFGHARFESKEIYQTLRRAGIVVATRNGLVRASPHFYNTDDEIDRLLAELPQ